MEIGTQIKFNFQGKKRRKKEGIHKPKKYFIKKTGRIMPTIIMGKSYIFQNKRGKCGKYVAVFFSFYILKIHAKVNH